MDPITELVLSIPLYARQVFAVVVLVAGAVYVMHTTRERRP